MFPVNIIFIKKAWDVIISCGIIYVILGSFFIKSLIDRDITNKLGINIAESFSKILSLPLGFILLTHKYHLKRTNVIACLILLITLIIAVIKARRGLIFISSSMLVTSYFLYCYGSGKGIKLFFLSILILCILSIFGKEIISNSPIFSNAKNRFDEDTRTPVKDCFYSDMDKTSWIIGRGLYGEYFCPGIDEYEEGFVDYRKIIETEYLNLILKGGVIYLIIIAIILIPAIIKGLFYSRNLLTKGAALWIFLWIIYLYPANLSNFTLEYLILWMSVSICYSKTFRETLDVELKVILTNYKLVAI